METPTISWQQRFFTWSIKYKSLIYWLFRLGYLGVLGVYILAVNAAFNKNSDFFTFYYAIGLGYGKFAIVLLGAIILPGILGRLGVNWPATRALTFFRRQIGIMVFLLVAGHYGILKILPIISGLVDFSPFAPFELFGLAAYSIFFIMYLTSNNLSMKKLGKWWKRIHRLIYLALWLIVFHTGLQSVSVWSVLIFAFALLELLSLFYAWNKAQSKKVASI